MKKSRRWLTLAASLLCGGTVFAAGLTSVTASADIVNGWDSGTPEGAAGNYGGVKGWAGGMTPGDMGDGFTRWVFINSHTIANNIALDVSKPITLTYSTKSNGSNQWMMFGLANSFDNAVKITTGMQESGNAAYRPFFFGHHADDNTDGANMFGEPVTWTAGAWDQVNDVCGADHWNGWTALEFTEVEIYFGEESASDGYILADGVYVGYPDAVQSDYESGFAYLVVSGFASSGVQIKVENTEKYTITANAENAAVVFDEIDALRRAGEGETISFTATANDGYRITSVTAGEQVLTAGADGKYSFTMPASDVAVTVATEAVYEVRYSGNAAVTFTGGTNVFAAGETVQFTVAPNDNYTVVSVSANGETLTAAEGVYSFEMPAADCEIAVVTEAIPDTYKVSVSGNATIAFDSGTDTYEEGQMVSFALTANEGYRITSVTAGEQALTAGADGKYSFAMPASDVTVTVATEAIPTYEVTSSGEGASIVLADGKTEYEEGDTVSFTVNVNAEYRLLSVKVGGETLTATEGVYSFVMPAADVTVTLETQAAYTVSSSGEGASVIFENGTEYAAGETVTFTVDIPAYCRLISVTADGQTLTADAEGKYSFVMPAADCEVVVSSEAVYTDPSEQTTESAVNGWNNEMYAEYPKYGPVVDAGGSSMVDERNGYSNFVLTNGGSIGSVIPLDVTKPIYLDLLVKPNGPVPGTTPWFMIGLFDDWDVTVESGADAYGQNGGAGADLNERINYYKKLMFGFNYSDITSEDPIDFRSFGNVTDISLEGITNKFGDAWGWASGDHSVDYDYARFEIYIGETASEGYIKLDGVKIASIGVTQADFRDGTAYLHMLSFYSVRVQARIYAGAELDYTSEVDERAEIIFAEGTDLNALKTYDTVSFRVEVPEGYGAIVAVNGTELRADADGNYTAAIGYGTCTISVSVEQLVTVSFETNGGGTLESVSVAAGGTIDQPSLTRAGYTLAWYADAAFTTRFDFTAPISESCTVYAQWTPVEYSIAYYDGADRIRDLLPVSYNIETETFALPTPVKEGYTFDGWYLSATFSGEEMEEVEQGSTGDITLYARWTAVSGGDSSESGGTASGGCGSSVSFAALGLAALGGAAIFLNRKRRD